MNSFFNNFKDLFLGVLDGAYGWPTEALTLLAIVLIFNYAVKWVLLRLHNRFSRENLLWHDSFVRALYKPLSYFIWFFAGVQFLELVDKYTLSEISVNNVHLTLAVGAIVALAWFLLRWKNNIVEYMTIRSREHELALDTTKIDVLDKLFTLIILFITALLLLEVTGSSLNTLIAFGGIGGLALAFASQEMVSNFFAGIMIYATQPFSKGDNVLLPEKKVEGTVEEIGWYMTRLRSPEKKPIYIPNSIFSKAVLINPSRINCRQFKEIIGVRYSDKEKLPELMTRLTAMLKEHPSISHQNPILVNLTAFGTYSLDVQVSAFSYVLDNDAFATVRGDLLYKIAIIIEEVGAEFATPATLVTLQNSGANGQIAGAHGNLTG